jgi:aspartyl-tRNA(Asn)/glutamyl-tRNA(Gln) amidotransferase subunit B
LIQLIDEGKTNFSIASQKIFPAMVAEPSKTPLTIAESLNLLQTGDEDFIAGLVNTVLASLPEKVAEYKGGKKGLLGLFVGEVMKASKGKADPKIINKLLASSARRLIFNLFYQIYIPNSSNQYEKTTLHFPLLLIFVMQLIRRR